MNTDQFIGMNLGEAIQMAKNNGLEVHVQTYGPMVLNNEFKPNRVSFKVEQGLVVGASLG